MKKLFEGIYTYYNANITGDIAGDIYFEEAPQNTSFPYVVYYLISKVPEYYLDEKTFEEVIIQFSIYDDDKSASDIMTYYAELVGDFDHASSISVTGYTVLNFEREFENLDRDIENGIWHYSIRYRCLLQKN